MDLSEPTRRRALWAVGAAGLAMLGAADGVRDAPRSPAGTATPTGRARVVPPPVSAAPVAGPPPPPLPGQPGWRPKPAPVRRKEVRTLDDLGPGRPPRSIALTIDDGPHPAWTPRILDVLAEHEVTATFFLIGEQVTLFPKMARRVADAGHLLCNHTMHHPIPFARLSGKRIIREIDEAHARIADITGAAPKFFRAPGGDWSKRVFEKVAEYGMIPIGWDVDPSDWRRPGVGHIRRTMMGSKAGAILLCHDGGGDRSQTLAALRHTVPKLKKRGFTFVPL
jgi:peptidoglycan-N-acetylglucosamine deacetylase